MVEPLAAAARRLPDQLAWQREDPKMLERISTLIEQCRRDPFRGTGKPEPLKRSLTGWWCRRVTMEHRLACRVRVVGKGQALEVVSCIYYY